MVVAVLEEEATPQTPRVNSAPEFVTGTDVRTIAENTPAGENVGPPISATDADAGDTLTHSLIGIDASSFGIVASSGQLQTKAPLDYETKSNYTVVP